MSENLKNIKSDDDFQKHLKEAGSRLVVVDFHALWCCHCQTMGPVFERFAPKYPLALFLKVNVDECTDTAIGLKVKCLPSFFFFRDLQILDNYCGGDDKMLEEKIKKLYEQSKGDQSTLAEQLQVSLSPFIVLGKCECLNETPEHGLKNALTGSGYLESKSSCKLMMTVVFSERINVQSLKIQAPADRGPKKLKLFIDHPKIFDFHDAEEMKPCETLELTLGDLDGTTLIPLSNPNFQYVDTLTIYVTGNQSSANKTQIDHLGLFGSFGFKDEEEELIDVDPDNDADDGNSSSDEDGAGDLKYLSVDSVLETVGLEMYINNLNLVNKTWDNLAQLNDGDLKAIGIESEASRWNIIGVLAAFANQLSFEFKNAKFVDVSPSNSEHKSIEKYMQDSIVKHRGSTKYDRYINLKIKKIINPRLKSRYEMIKGMISEDRNGDTNVRRLFHGSLFWRRICEDGFNVQLSNPKSMFGPGIYFAENSSKSNQYVFGEAGSGCPKHGLASCMKCPRQLLVCEVALGKTAKLSESAKFPHGPPGFDSVSAMATEFGLKYAEYVTYQNYQAMPTHLVIYQLQRDKVKK